MQTAAGVMIIERARLGDDAALATAVDQAFVSLVRIASLYLGSRSEAFAAVAATQSEALRGLDSYASPESPRAWVTGLLVDELRARALAAGAIASTARVIRGVEPAASAARFTPDGHWRRAPEHWPPFDHDRVEAILRSVIRSLPLDQREVAILRDVEGWSGEEVEALTGRPADEQRFLLQRARSCLQAALAAPFA